jgi:hypothetical protein
LRLNLLSIFGVIFIFASLTQTWWIMNAGVYGVYDHYGTGWGSKVVSLYLYQVNVTTDYTFQTFILESGLSAAVNLDIWYGWTALPLVIVGGIIGVIGCTLSKRKMLLISGIIVLSSVVVFVVGLFSELWQGIVIVGFPKVSLFSSGSTMWNSHLTIRYIAYLSYGFWMALLGAVLMFAAYEHRVWPRIKERPLEETEISQMD